MIPAPVLDLRPGPATPPRVTLDVGRRLVDQSAGIIRVLYESPVDPDSPQVFGFGSELADTAAYGVESFGSVNGSTSVDRERAAAAAVGEAVERYACRLVPYGDLHVATAAELGQDVVTPADLVLYDEEQYERPGFPYARYTDRTPVAWYPGRRLGDGAARWLPACAVFMARVEPAGARPLMQQTTNGLACGNTHAEAIAAGLSEVVERDAAMRAWAQQEALPVLDPRGADDPRLVRCLDLFAASAFTPTLVDLTGDVGVPVVLAWTTVPGDFDDGPVVATAAGVTAQDAARSALEELAQCIPWVRAMAARRSSKEVDLAGVVSTEDHVMWPIDRAHRHLLGPLLGGGTRRPLDLGGPQGLDPAATVDWYVARLAARGLEAFATDLTPPDVAQVGLVVTRVVVPQALPLWFGAGAWRTGARAARADGGPLQLMPHPFP
ncbi:YcaO-like family protein [Cellulomonas shaoxiangyii]|uniref:YcaO-like family protein n=1 Tax=Cellulomonas shaoxiangyii TaxID=2566013 RepID=UPI001408B004|nr:YcaO-like family protein [Cellulomonas shaoxiangyii]